MSITYDYLRVMLFSPLQDFVMIVLSSIFSWGLK